MDFKLGDRVVYKSEHFTGSECVIVKVYTYTDRKCFKLKDTSKPKAFQYDNLTSPNWIKVNQIKI